jgi:hypothetical protein
VSVNLHKDRFDDKGNFKPELSPAELAYQGPSMMQTKDDVLLRRKLEKKYGLDMPDKAEDLIFDLINSTGLYEKSTTAMHMIDKFERMMALYESNIAICKCH